MIDRVDQPAPLRTNDRLLSLVNAEQRAGSDIDQQLTVAPSPRLVRGGKIVAIPSANGSVRIVGTGERGQWLAEFSCLEEDFDKGCIRLLEQFIAERHGAKLELLQ